MTSSRLQALILLGLVNPAYSVAQVETRALARCAAITSPATRLKCYDDLAASAGANTPKATSATKQGTGRWDVRVETSPIDDSKNTYLTLESETAIKARFSSARPSLVLRCKEGKTAAYIDWNTYLGLDETDVLVRIDNQAASTDSWGISTDHEATFNSSPISFIKSLLNHSRLLVQVTPYGESPAMTTFALSGLEETVKALRSNCSW